MRELKTSVYSVKVWKWINAVESAVNAESALLLLLDYNLL